jgi:hypothetical protein
MKRWSIEPRAAFASLSEFGESPSLAQVHSRSSKLVPGTFHQRRDTSRLYDSRSDVNRCANCNHAFLFKSADVCFLADPIGNLARKDFLL